MKGGPIGDAITVEVWLTASDSGSDSDTDSGADRQSDDLARFAMSAVIGTAKDLRDTALDSPEVQQHFSKSPVSIGGPVPTRALEVSASASGPCACAGSGRDS